MSRRGFLGVSVAGGSVLLGTLLSACGGGSSSTATSAASSTQASSGGQSTPASSGASGSPASGGATASSSAGATAASGGATPKKGGTFQNFAAASPPSLDPLASNSQGQSEFSAFSYSRLYMLKSGPGVAKGSVAVVPDAAAKTEASPDGLTYTVTLRDNVMFHPPLSRNMTADDVVTTWNRMNGEAGATASDRVGDLNAVKEMTASDDKTVVITLKDPYPFFLQRLADSKAMFLMPKETGTAFNPAEKVVGSGPWVLTKYMPNSSAEFKRHPDWHLGPDLPYFDGVTTNVIPEYATQLSQFLAGNIDWVIVQSSDLKRVQDSVKGVQIYEYPPFPASVLNFSPNDKQWKDVRYRHAVSMALDRDAMLDAAYGLKDLENQGFKVTRYWHNYVPATFAEYWLDPKGTDITPEAAGYFKHDPDKAKSLIQEAGGGFSTELHYAAANSRYGDPYRIMSELTIEYLRDVGFDIKGVEEDYNSTFIPATAKGKFSGLMWIPQTRTDPFAYFQTQYLNPKDGLYGQWTDADLTKQLIAIQSLQDEQELVKQIRDIQNVLAQKMYVVPMQYGAATTYYAYQPWVQNATDYQSIAQGWPTEDLMYYWSNK
jgi:peptide/nickel transport system substrate-binding protein